MADDFLVYVQQSRITDWKRRALREEGGGVWPWVYAFDNPHFGEAVEADSVLWIVAAVNIAIGEGKYRQLPPMLVGRLEVAEIVDNGSPRPCLRFPEKHRFVARGRREGSRFYAANDATEILLDLKFGSSRKPWNLRDLLPQGTKLETGGDRALAWRRHCAVRFQTGRRIAGSIRDEEARELLNTFAGKIDGSQVFLSYRHCDHRKQNWALPVDFASSLIEAGLSPWLDRIAMPSSRALSLVTKQALTLTKLLEQGLSNSQAVIALTTPGYGGRSRHSTRSWTRYEWERDSLRIAWSPDLELPADLPEAVHTSRARMPDAVAGQVAGWLSRP